MNRLFWFSILVGFWGLLPTHPAYPAISLDFAPASQTVQTGQPVDVDVVISGLGRPPSVGAFDLSVSFDPTILSPTGVIFGLFLGDPSLLEALTDFTLSLGNVELAEVSLLSPAALDALQPADFTLATLAFDTVALGTSQLTFSQVTVDDAFGAKLAITAAGGSVAAVYEPPTILLLASGLIAIAGVWATRFIQRKQQLDLWENAPEAPSRTEASAALGLNTT